MTATPSTPTAVEPVKTLLGGRWEVSRVPRSGKVYNPSTGRYGLAIMRAVRIGGILTLLALGSFIFFSVKRERRKILIANPS